MIIRSVGLYRQYTIKVYVNRSVLYMDDYDVSVYSDSDTDNVIDVMVILDSLIKQYENETWHIFRIQ